MTYKLYRCDENKSKESRVHVLTTKSLNELRKTIYGEILNGRMGFAMPVRGRGSLAQAKGFNAHFRDYASSKLYALSDLWEYLERGGVKEKPDKEGVA